MNPVYYRALWVAALITGVANLLMFITGFGRPCLLAAATCGLICAITIPKETK